MLSWIRKHEQWGPPDAEIAYLALTPIEITAAVRPCGSSTDAIAEPRTSHSFSLPCRLGKARSSSLPISGRYRHDPVGAGGQGSRHRTIIGIATAARRGPSLRRKARRPSGRRTAPPPRYPNARQARPCRVPSADVIAAPAADETKPEAPAKRWPAQTLLHREILRQAVEGCEARMIRPPRRKAPAAPAVRSPPHDRQAGRLLPVRRWRW